MDGLTKPHFLGRLRQLTSNQWSVSRLEAFPGGICSPHISPRPQWAGSRGGLRGYTFHGHVVLLLAAVTMVTTQQRIHDL